MKLLLRILIFLLFDWCTLFAQEHLIRFKDIPENSPLAKESVWDIHQDRQGFLWFATRNVLVKYDGYDYTIYDNRPGDSTSLNNNYIEKIIEDPNTSTLWIIGNGLVRFDIKTEQFKNYSKVSSDSSGLSSSIVKDILQNEDGTIWIAAYGGSIDLFDPKTELFEHYEVSQNPNMNDPLNKVQALAKDKFGNILFATQAGIGKLNPQDREIIRFPIEVKRDVSNSPLIKDNNGGKIYLAGKRGLYQYHDEESEFELLNIDYKTLKEKMKGISWADFASVRMYVDSKDQLWISPSLQLLIVVSLQDLKTKVYHHDPLRSRPWERLPYIQSWKIKMAECGLDIGKV